MSTQSSRNGPAAHPRFSRTRWSRVLDIHQPEQELAQRSLFELSQRFWYPVYAYARRSGHAPEVANELCLAFFGQLPLTVQRVDPRGQGRFRDFLLDRLHCFLTEDWRKYAEDARLQDLSAPETLEQLEQRLAQDHHASSSPEQAFHRSFALEVLARSLRRLQAEAQQSGREDLFRALQPFLTREPVAGQYQELSRALGSPPLALVIAVKRLRQRFRELADDELMETVASPADLESERAALLGLLADGAA